MSSSRASAASYSRRRSAAPARGGTSTFATTIARPNRLSRITSVSAIIITAAGARPSRRPRAACRRRAPPRAGPEPCRRPRLGRETRRGRRSLGGKRGTGGMHRCPASWAPRDFGAMRAALLAAALVTALLRPCAARAQAWNTDRALALARRAVGRRSGAAADTTLRDYKAPAHV